MNKNTKKGIFTFYTVYKNCKEIAADDASAKDGVYELHDGKHFCKMTSLGSCGDGGWTLALKIDGEKVRVY